MSFRTAVYPYRNDRVRFPQLLAECLARNQFTRLDRMAMADGGERAIDPYVAAAHRWIARAQRTPRTLYYRLRIGS